MARRPAAGAEAGRGAGVTGLEIGGSPALLALVLVRVTVALSPGDLPRIRDVRIDTTVRRLLVTVRDLLSKGGSRSALYKD